MKKILLLMMIAIGCFAQLEVVETKPRGNMGFFFGAGLGMGVNAMDFFTENPINPNTSLKRSKTYTSFVLSAKAGGYHYFTKMLGLRYYYNLDLNFNPAEALRDPFQPAGPDNTQGFYVLSGSHTLNADALISFQIAQEITVAAIAGMGIGLIAGEYGTRYKNIYYKSSSLSNNFVDFEFRFNLGTRIMFKEKYGIEFMVKLPVTPSTLIYQQDQSLTNYKKSSPYYFTLDFVIERF